jgi:hypothetical protein
MLDDAMTGASTPLPRCMWCSAELPSDHETTCPTCGATLIGEGDSQVPGVTAIDAEAIIRAGRDTKPRQRSRLLSWISGEYPDEDVPAPPGSLDPPSADVRREILRLELEAQVANLQAEAGAMAAEQAVDAVDAGASPEAAKADAQAALEAADEAITAAAPAETLEALEPNYVAPTDAPAGAAPAAGENSATDASPDASGAAPDATTG